jgi:hypothetical protein
MKKSLHKALASVLTFSASSVPIAAQTFSEWTLPVNLGTTINSNANEV